MWYGQTEDYSRQKHITIIYPIIAKTGDWSKFYRTAVYDKSRVERELSKIKHKIENVECEL